MFYKANEGSGRVTRKEAARSIIEKKRAEDERSRIVREREGWGRKGEEGESG